MQWRDWVKGSKARVKANGKGLKACAEEPLYCQNFEYSYTMFIPHLVVLALWKQTPGD